MLPLDQALLIFGMALVTYIPRVLPLWLLSSKSLHPAFMRWLEMVPPAVLAALLAPALFLAKDESGGERLFLGTDNFFLLAAIPAFLVAWKTRSFFGTVAAGMAAVAVLRALM
ncbi:MAG: AzlD domain-containing protein [Deltaproteobacteria bacterium]|nr:AzlD domain-containing protein [Deltaproteobacteria bacterium]